MTESWVDRLTALGIPEADVKKALLLVRDLRLSAIADSIDPRAMRFAILFAEKVDTAEAYGRIKAREEIELMAVSSRLAMMHQDAGEDGKKLDWLDKLKGAVRK